MANGTPLSLILAGKAGGGDVANAVKYVPQNLTASEKAQARANIGASDTTTGLADDIKQALLNCFDHVAWTDEHGQDYVDALEAALYPLTSIAAVYTQSGTVYDTDSLDSLKPDLVVTAVYGDGTEKTVSASSYTLSGTLTVGTSTITVNYGGKTATFDVVVSSGILFQKTNWTLASVLDTNVALCETDIDFSVAMDVVTTTNPSSGDASKYRLVRIINAAGTSYALTVCKDHNSDTALTFRFMSASDTFGSPDTGRHRFVITHLHGTDSATIKYRKDNGTAETITLNSAFVSSSRNLILGQTSGENQLPAGTLNDFIIYDHIMSAHAIDAFLGL